MTLRPGQKLRAYRCPDPRCTNMPWHLTSIKQRYDES